MVSFVPMEDLGINQKYLVPSQSKPLNEVVGGYTYFADGDVLLAKITPCFENGKLGIAQDLKNAIGFGSSEYMVFRPIQTLNNEYLYYFLSRKEFRDEGARQMSGAVGHKRVSKEFVENYPVPLPPILEQQRIVAILDEAFDGISTAKANAEQNRKNAKELFDSYLQSVAAEDSALGDLVEIKTGKLDANAAVDGGQYPFFTCSREIFSIDSFAFDCEAVLLAGNNAVGDFNVKYYNGKFNAYQRTYVITANSSGKAYCRYLYFQLLRSLKEFKAKSVGAGTKFLKIDMIKNLRIPLPSIDEQLSIVAKLDDLSTETQRLESIYQQKAAALDELKQALLQRAFAGEL